MNGGPVNSIEQLDDDQSFYVILFCAETRRMFDDASPIPEMLPATRANKTRLGDWLAQMRTGGGTGLHLWFFAGVLRRGGFQRLGGRGGVERMVMDQRFRFVVAPTEGRTADATGQETDRCQR